MGGAATDSEILRFVLKNPLDSSVEEGPEDDKLKPPRIKSTALPTWQWFSSGRLNGSTILKFPSQQLLFLDYFYISWSPDSSPPFLFCPGRAPA